MNFPGNDHIAAVHFPPISSQGWLAAASPDLPLVDLCQAIPTILGPQLVEFLKGVLDDPRVARYSPTRDFPR